MLRSIHHPSIRKNAMPPLETHRPLTIGELSERSGVSASALHFYERNGLIEAERTAGNQRRYRRDTLRRVAFIKTSQRVGLPLKDIREALESLPDGRTPTKRDWSRLSLRWRKELDERIAALQHLRNDLDGCIGCGCLSLKSCTLQNPSDELGASGAGAQRWTLPE
ncbi:UNVERIFIED_CONTAM: MerR family redox-sensitive transcriptional activator SoxR [Jeotgalibacillus campisalis]